MRTNSDSKVKMHNKFAVIDNNVLITGSLNYTKQAVEENLDNCLITVDQFAAQCYRRRFSILWKKYAKNELVYSKAVAREKESREKYWYVKFLGGMAKRKF